MTHIVKHRQTSEANLRAQFDDPAVIDVTNRGPDPSKLEITSMKGLERTVRRFGRCLGHRRAFGGDDLLAYIEARRALYLPAYRWVLEHRLRDEVEQLRALGRNRTVVLLDYETNVDVDDPRKPLSHAGLVAAWLENRWPA